MNEILGKLPALFDPAAWIVAVETAVRRRCQRKTPRLAVSSFRKIHPTVTFDTDRRGSITIGDNVTLCQGVVLATFGGHITIADNVYIGPYSVIYGHGGLTIGRNTLIAAHTVIIPANHRFDLVDQPIAKQGETRQGIAIGEDCWLGAGVKVLDGTDIGSGAVIGAGAVVNRSIPARMMAAGIPARVIRRRTDDETQSLDPEHGPPAISAHV